MKSPIAIIIFNRPDNVIKLLDCLKSECDRDIFVISDGARAHKPSDPEKVDACRNLFHDWPGRIYFNFADSNMGCKERVVSGLNWVFEHTDRAIILEDDCLPHHDFFRFADELLERFENDLRVMSICGTNIFSDKNFFNWSYCFSKYQNCWGWATWKRSWKLFDNNLSGLNIAKETGLLREHLGTYRAAIYWHHLLDKVRNGKINSWAYIWTFTGFLNHGLHVIPKNNLITNVGFGNDSTHTTQTPTHLTTTINSMEFPLLPPPAIFPHPQYDQSVEDTIFSKSLYQRTLWVFRKSWRHY